METREHSATANLPLAPTTFPALTLNLPTQLRAALVRVWQRAVVQRSIEHVLIHGKADHNGLKVSFRAYERLDIASAVCRGANARRNHESPTSFRIIECHASCS